MKILFHIGQPKTGTTALQQALRANAEELRARGVLYPKTLHAINHCDLAIPAMEKVQRSMVSMVGRDYDRALQMSRESWRLVGEQVAGVQPATLLLSTEMIFKARRVEFLPLWIEEYLGEVSALEFLAYLRTPSEYYVSTAQQALKASSTLPAPTYNVARRLATFAEIGSVNVRKFGRSDLSGGDILTDVSETMGVSLIERREASHVANETVSAEGMILLQRYRSIVHGQRDQDFTRDTHELISRIRIIEGESPGRFTKAKLLPEYAQGLDAHSPDLTTIQSEYGVDLSQDHGVSRNGVKRIDRQMSVSDVISYDPTLLAELTARCRVDHLISVRPQGRQRRTDGMP